MPRDDPGAGTGGLHFRHGAQIESHDFYRPIISPFELELALTPGKQWTGEYDTDFRQLLPGLATTLAVDTAPQDYDAEAEFSLLTGAYRTRPDAAPQTSSAVAPRSENSAVATIGSAGLVQQVSWSCSIVQVTSLLAARSRGWRCGSARRPW